MRVRISFTALLFGASIACTQPSETVRPDVDAGVPVDAGVVSTAHGLKLKASHLTPAAGRASSPGHTIRAQIGAATGAPGARSDAYRLRGGVVAGGAHTSTTTR